MSYDIVLQQGSGTLVDQYGGLVGTVATFVVAFLAVYYVGRVVLVRVLDGVLERRGFDEAVRSLGGKVMGGTALVLAIAIAFTVVGYGSVLAAFATLAGALSLAVGFALQDLIANFVSGLFILKDKPFTIGDQIEWGEMSGRVEDIDLRVTRVRSGNNELVTVPNSELTGNAVTNPAAYDRHQERFTLDVDLDQSIDEVRDTILAEAKRVGDILTDPAPEVDVTELGDETVSLETKYWIGDPRDADAAGIRSSLIQAIKEQFESRERMRPADD
ncbi:mechanosensitive ion channel family protein [Halomicrococcus gelatinilyticus]|uniref:mechanosensitive ion channel family protein n=1 Tax=Halomicrococcus gelatinilyticus TaxID=1702103 RepID=UPI002E0E7275